jgi:serine/threonine protein kinase
MQAVTGPGHVIAGRYELLEVIGHGAMGTVWRARDLLLAREVAVKEVHHPGLWSAQDRAVARERSLREARVAARLTHPGVVTVHDVIEAEGSPWIVMELVRARSLARALAEDGPMSPARAAEMGRVLLEALGSAHAAGIVHRDVKPGNVLMTAEGQTVLTDFGIATVAGDPGLTQAGMVMGTPGFCAPERIRGAPASPASDLWSLGATLYAAVEGHGPFDGQDSAMAVLANIVHGDPPPAASAGPLSTVITALMNRDPAARPDAAAARRLLSAACGGGQTTAGQEETPAKGAVQISPATGSPSTKASARPPGGAQSVAGQPVAEQPVAGPPPWMRPGTPAVTPAGRPRRPGRHRRGLLLGGGGAAAG